MWHLYLWVQLIKEFIWKLLVIKSNPDDSNSIWAELKTTVVLTCVMAWIFFVIYIIGIIYHSVSIHEHYCMTDNALFVRNIAMIMKSLLSLWYCSNEGTQARIFKAINYLVLKKQLLAKLGSAYQIYILIMLNLKYLYVLQYYSTLILFSRM